MSTKKNTFCLAMIELLFDSSILAASEKCLVNQNIRAGKCCKLLPAIFSSRYRRVPVLLIDIRLVRVC